MSWTHILAFGIGAVWMLVVFITAGALRPWHRNPDDLEIHTSWTGRQSTYRD